MGYYVIKGGSNYVKVKDPETYESLLNETHAYVWLPDERGRLRYQFNFSEHWDCGNIYYIRDDEQYFHNFLDEAPGLLEQGEVLVQLYSSSFKDAKDSILHLGIAEPGQPVKRIFIEPEIAAIWKMVLDRHIELNSEIIQRIEELEKPHTEQLNEKWKKKYEAEEAIRQEEKQKRMLEHPEEFEKEIDDDQLPF